ncbi:hypothetical protein EVAR_42811_1 [Eumeta japonica]|uniref:Uncharacterized protein n=1 Tax=Eumeta variegata TaxID=151549 RepID=A0A4C1WH10_EUMVA|nr:hypothetical protein EVAR_42811_1 [Eumeta japonica]
MLTRGALEAVDYLGHRCADNFETDDYTCFFVTSTLIVSGHRAVATAPPSRRCEVGAHCARARTGPNGTRRPERMTFRFRFSLLWACIKEGRYHCNLIKYRRVIFDVTDAAKAMYSMRRGGDELRAQGRAPSHGRPAADIDSPTARATLKGDGVSSRQLHRWKRYLF